MTRKTLAILAVLVITISSNATPIPLVTGIPHAEDFDTLISSGSVDAGQIDSEFTAAFWGSEGSGWWNGSDTVVGQASEGHDMFSSFTKLLSYGNNTVPERALGLSRRPANRAIGAQFRNASNTAITQLDISYEGELWYYSTIGIAGAGRHLIFEYSLDATSLLDGVATWTEVPGLHFRAPDAPEYSVRDGNADGNRAPVSDSLTGLSIARDATFFLRWSNSDTHGMGIDNFLITATVPEPSLVTLIVGTLAAAGLLRR